MDAALNPARRKAEARLALAEARRKLPAGERRDRSRKIIAACQQLPGFSTADLICSYVNFREEVETTELLTELLRAGRRVAVPVQLPGATQSQSFAEIESLAELIPSGFGILQPRREAARFLPTGAIPLFLVPGLAFDSAGRRLGYGLGFYDRAFAAAAPGAIKIGLAFELQIVERVPADAHDVLMDVVVTEERVIPAAGGEPTRRR